MLHRLPPHATALTASQGSMFETAVYFTQCTAGSSPWSCGPSTAVSATLPSRSARTVRTLVTPLTSQTLRAYRCRYPQWAVAQLHRGGPQWPPSHVVLMALRCRCGVATQRRTHRIHEVLVRCASRRQRRSAIPICLPSGPISLLNLSALQCPRHYQHPYYDIQ